MLGLYRLVLCREPESPGIVMVQRQHDEFAALLWQCLRSEEFQLRYRATIRRAFQVR